MTNDQSCGTTNPPLRHRRASFDITSLCYYSANNSTYAQQQVSRNANPTTLHLKKRCCSVHKLPSQLEYTSIVIEKKLRNLRMEQQSVHDGGLMNNNEVVLERRMARRGTDCSDDTERVRNLSGHNNYFSEMEQRLEFNGNECENVDDEQNESSPLVRIAEEQSALSTFHVMTDDGGMQVSDPTGDEQRGLMVESHMMVGGEKDQEEIQRNKKFTLARLQKQWNRHSPQEEEEAQVEQHAGLNNKDEENGGNDGGMVEKMIGSVDRASTKSEELSPTKYPNSSNTTNAAAPDNVDILTEGQYFLSISMLVYMYSHLRETCRMGHTRVKMEDIDCNTNEGSRSSTRRLSYMSMGSTSSMGSSMSPLELSLHLSGEQQQKRQQGSNYLSGDVLTAGAIIRIVIDELEDFHNDENNDYYDQCYNSSNSYHRDYEKSVMKEFKKWIDDSRVSQLDSNTQELIASLRKRATKARWRRAMGMIRITRSARNLVKIKSNGNIGSSVVEEDDSAKDENKKQMIHYLKRQVARYRWKRAIAKVRLSIRLNGGRRPKPLSFGVDGKAGGNKFVDKSDFLQKGLEKNSKYFLEGSVMSNLIESSLEVVWFSDLTQNDVVYGICVQREEKKITVVFRGTVNAHNWSMNLRYDMMTVPNPISEYYPGRVDKLDLHSGFALYLLRRRKDTGLSKMGEIFEKIEHIGQELAPDGNYKICITGHSMGGALATLFGFFLSAKLCQRQETPKRQVQIYTFASPRVGGQSFLYAYQHLERLGRIRHARFSSSNDIVPLIPFCNFQTANLKFYKHVGMRVQLHSIGSIGKWRLRKRLDVTYPLFHDWSSTISRGLLNCILARPSTFNGYKMHHTLTEYQARLHFALMYRKALASTVFFLDEKRQRLKSLDEYYTFRCNVYSNVTSKPSMVGFNIYKHLQKACLVVPLMYIWTRLLSKVTCAEILLPKILHWIVMEQVPKIFQATPFFAIFHYLLMISLGLSFMFEVIKIAINCRWVGFKIPPGRLLLVAPLLGIWSKLFLRLTDVAIPKNIHTLILQQLFNLWEIGWELASVFVEPIYKLLQLSFGLSFVMVALGSALRSGKNRWGRSLGKMLLATTMLTAWVLLFKATSKNMAADNLTTGVRNANKPGWGLGVDNGRRAEQHLDLKTSSVINAEDMRSESNIVSSQMAESQLAIVHEQLRPIQEYATGIKFAPTLGNGLYLVGAGVRKKSVIKVYAVAMYSTPQVLLNANSPAALHDSARTFDSTSSMTSFVLEMVYSAGAEKIAGAIAESVKPRYSGTVAGIGALESLIVEGVKAIGGQAVKGTKFRFDCSEEGVSVSVNDMEQGVAAFEGLGSAFVDVFMDGNSVSPTLVESCVSTWSTAVSKSVASSLVELSKFVVAESKADGTIDEPDKVEMRKNVESQLKPIQEYATSVVFNPKLDEGLYLVGAGVRKKSVVKVYAVALYGSASVLNSAASPAALRTAARSFDTSTPLTSFALEMVYSASAEKIGGAIADSVKPRYSGPASDISVLESLIIEGVNKKGGQATKGTTFRFDCSEDGVTVSVDGSVQGTANSAGLGSAFVDVFLDDDAVSPTLVSSCLDTWSNPQAKALAASILELQELENDASTNEQDAGDEVSSSGDIIILEEVESQLEPIQEYATGIIFSSKLDNELYLVGAGVRKKSVIKVYAVAMYSTPQVLQNANSPASLHDAARTFDSASSMTSFVLEMVYSAGAEKIAGAIAESVKPRHNGDTADIGKLEALIVEGVHAIGGQAVKGTKFRFDCSKEGVSVSVNGMEQGVAAFEGLGSAFVDVFMDGNSVSPTLVESCVSTWSKQDAKLLATTLVELHERIRPHSQNEDAIDTNGEHNEMEIEANKEYSEVEIDMNTTADDAEDHEPNSETKITATTISSKDHEGSTIEVEKTKKPNASPPPQKHNILKKIVKYAFPVF